MVDEVSPLVVRLYCQEMKSIPQIAAEIGAPRSRVRTMLLAAGVTLRSRADGVRLRRDVLGKHCLGIRRGPMPRRVRKKISAARRKWAEEHAVGVSIKPNGYLEITMGIHKGRGVHAVVAEEKIKRKLRKTEVVHHIDENKLNNDPENLRVMTRSEHARHHRAKRSTQ